MCGPDDDVDGAVNSFACRSFELSAESELTAAPHPPNHPRQVDIA
jgi:hypothetical protein